MRKNEIIQKPHLQQRNVGSWASSDLKNKVKYHLKRSVKAWHDWDKDLPLQVEVICNEVKSRRGKFINVRRWLIIPAESGLKECLVAEIDNDVHIHINHLAPAVFLDGEPQYVSVKQFADSIETPITHWVETADGIRHNVNGNLIDFLHHKWMTSPFARRNDNDDFTIFEFTTPQDFKITLDASGTDR